MTCEFFGPSSSSESVDDIENFPSLSENQVNLGFYDFIHRLALVSSFFACEKLSSRLIEGCLSSLCDWEQPQKKKRVETFQWFILH